MWLGVSVENQAAADERIPLLLQTPAAIRFLSCEPLLGPINLAAPLRLSTHAECKIPGEGWLCIPDNATGHLSWVICGGESGRNARPFDVAWARSIIGQCRAAGVAPFVKQLGAWPFEGDPNLQIFLRDSHGGDMEEWPEDLRIREFPATEAIAV